MNPLIENAEKLIKGEVPPSPIARLLGMTLKSVERGHVVFEMQADTCHHNPMGTLHGGVYCDLADIAMGYAYASTLGDGEGFTTVELKINFFRGEMGDLIADAKIVKEGTTLGYVECDVCEPAGKLLARAASTCMTLRPTRRDSK